MTALSGLFFACGGATESAGAAAEVSPKTGSIAAPSTTSVLRAVGAPCAFATQCASGGCSADVAAGGCGVCLDVRPLGARCDAALLGCSASALCRDGICQSTKKILGQPCRLGAKGDSGDCDDELFCGGQTKGETGEAGACTAKSGVGGSCAAPFRGCTGNGDCERGICSAPRLGAIGDSCEARRCEDGLSCHGGSDGATCQRPRVLPRGARCDGYALGLDCESGTRCELTGGPAENGLYPMACVAGRAEGEECASSHCAVGLFCGEADGETTSRCLRVRHEGEACHDGDCIAELECRQNRCAAACR